MIGSASRAPTSSATGMASASAERVSPWSIIDVFVRGKRRLMASLCPYALLRVSASLDKTASAISSRTSSVTQMVRKVDTPFPQKISCHTCINLFQKENVSALVGTSKSEDAACAIIMN